MRALPITLLMALLAFPAFPQGKLVETIEVRVANIDVVVRDSHGNPVNGLTKADFQLFENKVEQTITNLYEVRRADADAASQAEIPLEVRQRRILIFVDSASMPPTRKADVLASLQKFVDQQMRPEDQAMLVSWRLGVDIITPFTNDKAELKRGMDRLARIAPGGERQSLAVDRVKRDIAYEERLALDGEKTWSEAYSYSIHLINMHASQLTLQQERTLDAIEHMVSTLAGFEGKKVLVLVTDHLPEHPGAELYRYVNDEFSPHMGGTDPLDLQAVQGLMGNHMPQEVEQLGKNAAANGVTIYGIGSGQAQDEFSPDNRESDSLSEAASRVSNTASALQAMADVTGGVSINRTSNFDLAFDTIRRDLDSYYSLGYKPHEGEETPRKIVVKCKDPRYHVRARNAFVLKSSDSQMYDRVISNLFSTSTQSDWPINVRVGVIRDDGAGNFLVPVQVVMPATLTLLPQDGNLLGGFVLYFAIGTSDGRTSEVMRKPQGLKIPPPAEKAVRAKPMTYTTAIRVKPGESVLSVAIVDQISGTTGYARAKILARPNAMSQLISPQ